MIVNHEWLDTAEQRAQMAASVTLPIDQFLALIAVARNGLRPKAILAAPAAGDVKMMRDALERAVSWFDEYAAGHRIKGAVEKAERNQLRADSLRAALAAPAPDAVAEEREAIARIFDAKAAEWMLRASHPAMKKVALEWVAHHEQYAAMVRARSAAQRNPAAPRDGREK
jgi:hypothetical protein